MFNLLTLCSSSSLQGVVYSERGEFDLAMRHYQLAIDRNPNYVEALCNIGVIFKNAGELALSIEYYDRALKANPNFAIANSNLSIALTDMGTAGAKGEETEACVRLYRMLRSPSHHPRLCSSLLPSLLLFQ